MTANPRMIFARYASRRSVLPAATHDRNVACCSLVNATSAARIPATYHIREYATRY